MGPNIPIDLTTPTRRQFIRRTTWGCLGIIVVLTLITAGIWYAVDEASLRMNGNVRFNFYGEAVDEASGQPIAGATIDLCVYKATSPNYWMNRPELRDVTLTTDAKGRFQLKRARGYQVALRGATAPGYTLVSESSSNRVIGSTNNYGLFGGPPLSQDPLRPYKLFFKKVQPAP
jgi:hypothetical protein